MISYLICRFNDLHVSCAYMCCIMAGHGRGVPVLERPGENNAMFCFSFIFVLRYPRAALFRFPLL